ncbi:MAG: O-antigen ligase family protein [Patescibacteria group bacterium]|nr:O-antigen ligase family protein [Patescibacteria group bacterium]
MRNNSFIKTKALDSQLKKFIFICFNLLLFITPFLFTWNNEELFEFIKMLFVYGMTTIITTLWIGRIIVRKSLVFRKTKIDIPLIIFIASQILATVFSIHPRTSIFGYYTRFHGGLLSTVSYALLYWAFVSNLSKKSIRLLLLTLMTAGGLISLYAIPEHFGHSLSCQLIHGHFDVSCWVQDVQNRVFASFGQPNWLAAFLITLIPINITLYLTTKHKKQNCLQKWLLLLNSFLMTTALLFTKSRSGFLGFVAGLAIMSLLLLIAHPTIINVLKKNSRSKKNRGKELLKSAGLILLSLILPIIIFGSPYSSPVTKFIKTNKINQESVDKQAKKTIDLNISGTDSGDIRKIVWKGALQVWKRYPIFGSGVETFAYSYYQDRPMEHNLVSEWDFLYNKAHNEFLNYLATTGIVGLTAYCLMLGSFFYLALTMIIKLNSHKHKKSEENILLTTAIAAGISALVISNFLGFSTVAVSILLYILPGFIIVNLEEGLLIKKTNKLEKLGLFNLISLLLSGLIGIHCLLGVYKIWKADTLFVQSKSLINLNEYQEGVLKLQTAIQLAPKEALFYDELASSYSDIALQFNQINEASAATEFNDLAIKASDRALKLNSRHLNFYRTRINLYTRLAFIDPDNLNHAIETLESARELAPTNPKLVYQSALIRSTQDELEEAVELLELALEMKPNYHQARYKLAEIFLEDKQYSQAKKHYQYILKQVPSDFNVKNKIEAIEASASAQDKN